MIIRTTPKRSAARCCRAAPHPGALHGFICPTKRCVDGGKPGLVSPSRSWKSSRSTRGSARKPPGKLPHPRLPHALLRHGRQLRADAEALRNERHRPGVKCTATATRCWSPPTARSRVEFVECLASCGSGPVCMVNDDLHEHVTAERPRNCLSITARHAPGKPQLEVSEFHASSAFSISAFSPLCPSPITPAKNRIRANTG